MPRPTKKDAAITLPLVPMRGVVLFPKALLSLDIGRAGSVAALEEALENDSVIMLTAQKDSTVEEPAVEDLHEIGVIAHVRQILKMPGNMVRMVAEGMERGRILSYPQRQPYFKARVKPWTETAVGPVATGSTAEDKGSVSDIQYALTRTGWEAFEAYAEQHQKLSPEAILTILNCELPGQLADAIASHAQFEFSDKQRILEESDPIARLEYAIACLYREIETLKLQQQIYAKVRKGLDKNQREYFLREQLKAIHAELGDGSDNAQTDAAAYRERMKAMNLPSEVIQKLTRELSRLERSTAVSPESGVIRDYLECVLDMPWDKKTEDNVSLTHAETVLDEDHFGLEKVKERILEFLAVRQAAKNPDTPILCLMGPPGVGKTSVARSVARALGRRYVRISLGGVRDEAEIRGHRKTYIGAMPGRVMNAVKQAGTANPLLLLDEIDKMNSDFRGNPAAALLEVLDGEQNKTFRDHYLELPFDLSDVLFLCTANTLDGVPPALTDRLEIIPLSSYTADEKFVIASHFLIPKQLKKHGLTRYTCVIKPDAVDAMIRNYTREAGVRELERVIAQVCRKTVRGLSDGRRRSMTVSAPNLTKFLGKVKYKQPDYAGEELPGICRGLAWTPVGGVMLDVEVNTMPGTGKFELTGNMGAVMKESAQAAVSYVRSRSEVLGLPKNFHKNLDIHIHIPEGATPKDGPSAGITMATAIVSALTGRVADITVAMTGEITLRGRVLPVGGLKEKLLAAKQAGITKVLLPYDNEGDVAELPKSITEGMVIVPVKSMDEVLERALIYD